MNKTDLIAKLKAQQPWMRTSDARQIIDALLGPDGIIASELVADRSVTITGFGTFDVTHVARRFVTPPRQPDGVIRGAIEVPAHRRPVFRAGKGLKSRVAG